MKRLPLEIIKDIRELMYKTKTLKEEISELRGNKAQQEPIAINWRKDVIGHLNTVEQHLLEAQLAFAMFAMHAYINGDESMSIPKTELKGGDSEWC